jgi:uncharacterized protein (TIGR02270 family)
MTPALRPILWDIYEEHLEEAAFLWGQWRRALVAANYTIEPIVVGPEERLLAHLDGLVLGGRRVAEKLLAPALADEDAGKVFAAAWSLLHAEDADHLEPVLARIATAEPPSLAALRCALDLSPRGDLAGPLASLWERSGAPLRASLFELVAARDARWSAERLGASLESPDSALQAAALRTLRRAPDRTFAGPVERALQSEDAAVRAEAVATGFLLRLGRAHETCFIEAQRTDEGCRLPLALLAAGGTPRGRSFLEARLAAPGARPHVLWALGFTGDVDAADAMVAALEDEAVAKVAGEALTAITGVPIAGALVTPGVPKGPGTEDVEADDPIPETRAEDLLPAPAPAAVRQWWPRARERIERGVRYVYGQPRTIQTLGAAMAIASMPRRAVMALELGAAGVPTRTEGWARRQSR